MESSYVYKQDLNQDQEVWAIFCKFVLNILQWFVSYLMDKFQPTVADLIGNTFNWRIWLR